MINYSASLDSLFQALADSTRRTVMRSPEGQEFPNLGCYLEIVPNQKLVFTEGWGKGLDQWVAYVKTF